MALYKCSNCNDIFNPIVKYDRLEHLRQSLKYSIFVYQTPKWSNMSIETTILHPYFE